MFEELKNIKTSKKNVRSFGITIGVVLLIISAILFYHGKSSHQIFAYLGGGFIGLGIITPVLLKPIYTLWMTFAVIFGWAMTNLILSIIFYFILTPIGLMTRFMGEDFLKQKKVGLKTYWNNRNSNYEINQDYEKQF